MKDRSREMYTDGRFPPFYIGQRVVGVNALPGSKIINGQEYIITACHYSPCKGKMYWYVGVKEAHDWLWPGLFAPIETQFEEISFEKVVEKEQSLTSAN